MLDRYLRPRIDVPLTRLGRVLAARGVHANAVTLVGLGFSVAAGVAIATGWFGTGLVLILASRLADGLDGAVARAMSPEDFGGFLDIVADFVFYAAVPLAFVVLDPATNGIAGALLLAAFYVNAATFLGFGVLAAKRGMSTEVNGPKAWYHATGLLEGTETIAFFIALCLWPAAFVPLAWGFALLCLLTAALRVFVARSMFYD